MLVTELVCPKRVSNRRIKHFAIYSIEQGWSLKAREIDPTNVIVWVLHSAATEGDHLFRSQSFKDTFYFLLKSSNDTMSLFLKLSHVKKIAQNCKTFDGELFLNLFRVFLEASKSHATNPNGRDLIKTLPSDELPNDKGIFGGWFLSLTNECFKMLSVVDFYLWLCKDRVILDVYDHFQFISILNSYKDYLKRTYSRGKSKKKSLFITYVLRFLAKKGDNTKNMVNEHTKGIIQEFTISKAEGIPIVYKGVTIYDGTWTGINLVHNPRTLEGYIKKVVKIRGYSEINNFSVFSLTLQDYINIRRKYKVTKEERGLLKQFIPYLLETYEIPTEQRESLENFYVKMPKVRKEDRSTEVVGKNFITRADFIRIINIVFSTCKERTLLRNLVYLILICFCALRKSCAMQIQVQDFVLDDLNLLKDIGRGYGRLILPAYKSKGGYSPSINPYHIAVVPRARDMINRYLKSEHMKGYNKETYLMRRNPVSEHDPLFDEAPTKRSDRIKRAQWVIKIGEFGDTIVHELYKRAQPLIESEIKGTLSSHDFRRSGNNWIQEVTSKDLSAGIVYRTGEIHLRHKKTGSVNIAHYTRDPYYNEYMYGIDRALNFPWDLDELFEWEQQIAHGAEEGLEAFGLTLSTDQIHHQVNKDDLIQILSQNSVSPLQRRVQELKQEIFALEQLLENKKVPDRIRLEAKLRNLRLGLNKLKGGLD